MQTRYRIELKEVGGYAVLKFGIGETATSYTHVLDTEGSEETIAEALIKDFREMRGYEEEAGDVLPPTLRTQDGGDMLQGLTEQVKAALTELKEALPEVIGDSYTLELTWHNATKGRAYGNEVYMYREGAGSINLSEEVYLGDPCYFRGEEDIEAEDSGIKKVGNVLPGRYNVHIERSTDNRRPERVYIIHERYHTERHKAISKVKEAIGKLPKKGGGVLPVDSGQFGIYDKGVVPMLKEEDVYTQICAETCRRYVYPDESNLYNGLVTSTHNGDGGTSVQQYSDQYGRIVGFAFYLP